jgi:hypothetical protein
MKYTFQDSTELPVQRDFIRDMRDFVDVCRQVLPIEAEAIEKNEEIRERLVTLKQNLKELGECHEKSVRSIETVTRDPVNEEIKNYRNSVLKVCKTSADSGKKHLESRIETAEKELDDKMKGVEEQILSGLNPFFEGGIYGTEKSYSATHAAEELKGVLVAVLGPMEYQSEITFDRNLLTVKYLMGSLFLPKWTKTGFISKEDKVKMDDVSEFNLISFEYDGKNHKEAVFGNKKTDRSLKVTAAEEKVSIYLDGVEITADEVLSSSVKIAEINSLLSLTTDYIKSHIKSRRLFSLRFSGENAVRNTEVFDCLKLVAEQYSEIIQECFRRGYVENEITIKLEQQDGTRTEKYLSRAEVIGQLSEIGSEGLEIVGVLGIE